MTKIQVGDIAVSKEGEYKECIVTSKDENAVFIGGVWLVQDIAHGRYTFHKPGFTVKSGECSNSDGGDYSDEKEKHRNPLALPKVENCYIEPDGEIMYYDPGYNDDTSLPIGLGFDTGDKAILKRDQMVAIVDCRKVLDEIRGDWVPDWGSDDKKYFLSYSHRKNKFIVEFYQQYQYLSDFWYLASSYDCESFIEQIDHKTLYLALYGKKLK